MTWITTALRRSLWLVLVGAAGGLAWSWWRDRSAPPSPDAAPEWPPLPDAARAATPSAPASVSAARDAVAPPPASPLLGSTTTAVATDAGQATSDGAPDESAGASAATSDWVEPDPDGECPPSHPVKANDNSGIYHVPGGRFYARTKAERCYATAEAAAADGYRPAKA